MDKNELFSILNDWNFWNRDVYTGILRDTYVNKLRDYLTGSNQILVITGARRSGKSIIMKQLAKDLMVNGHKKEEILIVNFEDPRFTGLTTQLLKEIYETYLEFLGEVKKPFIFLDEVQEVDKWEKWANTMQELNKARIIISGSNARLLSRELATLVTGRHLDLEILPLSFREFLNFKQLTIKDEADLIDKRILIKGLLREYLEFGAFPEVVLSSQKKELQLMYFEDILNKDIVRKYRIRKSEKLKSLAKYYLSNVSNLITFSSLGKQLGIATDTVEKYSGYFEASYLIFFVKRFSFKVKEQEKSPRKVYAIDTGLANTIGFRFAQNWGRVAENIVFLELLRKKAKNLNLELHYWKDIRHREVDFVVKEGLQVKELIQVCWQLNSSKTRDREVNALLLAMTELKMAKGLIITEDYEGREEIQGKQIEFIPLWKWLL